MHPCWGPPVLPDEKMSGGRVPDDVALYGSVHKMLNIKILSISIFLE
jgi:hypothetical protein